MAQTQRFSGDANGVVNVDIGLNGVSSVGKVISTGIGKHPTAYKIVALASLDAEMGVGGKVETALRVIQVAGTTIAYQVDGIQLSVLCEATGWSDAALEAALANVAVLGAGTTCTSTTGIKLA